LWAASPVGIAGYLGKVRYSEGHKADDREAGMCTISDSSCCWTAVWMRMPRDKVASPAQPSDNSAQAAVKALNVRTQCTPSCMMQAVPGVTTSPMRVDQLPVCVVCLAALAAYGTPRPTAGGHLLWGWLGGSCTCIEARRCITWVAKCIPWGPCAGL
jgi:hypothetical protein